MANKKQTDNALNNLLASAGPEILRDLVSSLAFQDPEVRRTCFEYLKAHAPLSTTQKQTSDGEVVLALWEELYPDLEEMDDCWWEMSEAERDEADRRLEESRRISAPERLDAVDVAVPRRATFMPREATA